MELEAAIRGLPKIEQHVHILGSIRPRTLLSIIEREGLEPPFDSEEDLLAHFQYTDFPHFIEIYKGIIDYVCDERYFEQITYEMLESCSKSNVHYVEASFSAVDHTHVGLDFFKMIDAINDGIRRAEQDFPIEANIRIDLVRNFGPERGMEMLDLIEQKPDNIISVDIGGSEQRFPPKPFAPVYARAKEMGLHLVAHAGEAAGPQSIWDAVSLLNVERIGHGVSAKDDPELLRFLAQKGVVVETCPISNVRTGAVPDIRSHPIRTFIESGISVTVNSDDPSLFHTDMNNEYLQLYQHLHFKLDELFQLSLNGINSSFISDTRKHQLQESFTEKFNTIMSSLE